ncbi:MAG: TolC family protein [Calditrichaeota bacterium]|nr:MAG: TolC family protein [Calditrichota bacterium]
MINKVIWLIILSISVGCAGETTLDRYISFALENNLALQQKEFSYEKSIFALREARGMFLPTLDAYARYSQAEGGRTIYFPVGDLLNPIYQTLNQLTGFPVFPTNIPNQTIPFLREKEQETRLRVTQPVFHPQIYYNLQIKRSLNEIEDAARRAFARQLVADVKTAYYNHMTAVALASITERTGVVLQENLRVSQKLCDMQMATIDAVYRAEAAWGRFLQQKAEADKLLSLSQAFFNFMLNRPLDTSIDGVDSTDVNVAESYSLAELEESSLQNREEFIQLDAALIVQQNGVRLDQAAFLPGLTVVFDYGFQGEEYRFVRQDDYWMASAVLQWNLFNGFRDRSRVQQAKLEYRRLELQREMLKKQILLDVRTAFENVQVADFSLAAAEQELKSARKNFDLVSKKWEQGAAPQLAFYDAQSTLAQAEINQAVKKFNRLIRYAEAEKSAASLSLDAFHPYRSQTSGGN